LPLPPKKFYISKLVTFKVAVLFGVAVIVVAVVIIDLVKDESSND